MKLKCGKDIIELLLTDFQIETINLKVDILKSIDNNKPLKPQFVVISKHFISNNIPVSPMLVKKYYYQHFDAIKHLKNKKDVFGVIGYSDLEVSKCRICKYKQFISEACNNCNDRLEDNEFYI